VKMQTLLQSLLLLFAGISIATASVWVNEVADKGDYTVCGGAGVVAGRDWVELYNDATSAADISGWKIHDDHGPDYTQAYIFPVGTILPPKSYTILCQADSFIFGIGGYVRFPISFVNQPHCSGRCYLFFTFS